MIRSIVSYAARSGHPGRCGSTCAIRFNSAARGYLLFDDTVLDKRHSHFIEMVRRQWSGNAHAVIPGIGVVTCVYVNSELQRFLVLDFHLFDPGRLDGFVVRQQEGDQSDRGGPQGLLLPSQAEPTGNTGPGNALPTTGYSTLR